MKKAIINDCLESVCEGPPHIFTYIYAAFHIVTCLFEFKLSIEISLRSAVGHGRGFVCGI